MTEETKPVWEPIGEGLITTVGTVKTDGHAVHIKLGLGETKERSTLLFEVRFNRHDMGVGPLANLRSAGRSHLSLLRMKLGQLLDEWPPEPPFESQDTP